MFYQLNNHYHGSQRKWRISIIGGTGAVGAYFAKQLLMAGHCVSIVGKNNSQSLKYLLRNGLTLITSQGETNTPKTKFNYIGDFAHFPKKEKQDLIILSLKQFDMSEEIAKQITEITDEHSIIGVIANGLPFYFFRGLNYSKKNFDSTDIEGRITHQLQDRKIIGIQPVIASRVVSPGVIHVMRPLTAITVVLGEPENIISEKMEDLHKLLNVANITTLLTTDLRKNILEKLQFALSVNTLSALMEKNIGYIFNAKETQALILYSITLINQIAKMLDLGTLRSYEQFKSIAVTKEHFSSLFYDIKAGKPGETEAIVGATIELAYFAQQRHPMIQFPNLEPLKLLKHLLELKLKKVEITELQLTTLFTACQTAVDSLNENKIKIKAKL